MIIGIDEAGRGPLAGPVCAAAVILPERFNREYLDDSKKLSPAKREMAEQYILKEAFAFGIGWASHTEIDEINILQASLLAMKRAFEEMTVRYGLKFSPDDKAIVDGLNIPDISIHSEAMVKADAKIPEVMAASILAKTARDRHMLEMAKLYPQYGYDRHKGYPTKAHREAVLKYGPSPIQRMSFSVK